MISLEDYYFGKKKSSEGNNIDNQVWCIELTQKEK